MSEIMQAVNSTMYAQRRLLEEQLYSNKELIRAEFEASIVKERVKMADKIESAEKDYREEMQELLEKHQKIFLQMIENEKGDSE